jgi:hypothetical protein
MLDDLDRELWTRGHRFVRYADDLRVFVRSERAANFGSGPLSVIELAVRGGCVAADFLIVSM